MAGQQLVVVAVFFKVACKIRRAIQLTSWAAGSEATRRRMWRTALKMGLYPLAVLVSWLPSVLVNVARWMGGTEAEIGGWFVWKAAHAFLTGGLGWINFVILCLTNTQLREHIPGLKWCRRYCCRSCCCGETADALRWRRPSWTPNPTAARDTAVEMTA